MEDYSIPEQAFQAPKESGGIPQQAIMPIVAIADNRLIPLGTGFVVGSGGVMITAKHVVEEYISGKLQDRETGACYDVQGLFAFFITNEVHTRGPEQGMGIGGLWQIDFVWTTSELDIAYCWLRQMLKDGERFFPPVSLKLSPGIPTVGEHILAFGYYNSIGGSIMSDANGQSIVDYEQRSAFASGVIQAIYPEKRDSVMLRFPSFATTARFEPGLSGGPVMNQTGGVCGVVVSSYSGLIENGYISYASLIWPSLGTDLEMVMEGESTLKLIPVYELCRMGVVASDGTWNQFQLIDNEDGSRVVKLRDSTISFTFASPFEEL